MTATPVDEREIARDYVARCVAAKETEPSYWSYSEGALGIDEDFSVRLKRRFTLVADNMGSVRPVVRQAGNGEGIELIPFPYWEASSGQIDSVEIARFGTSRVVLPVDHQTIGNLGKWTEKERDSIDQFVCLPLRDSECSASSSISLTSVYPGSLQVDSFHLRNFLPFSSVNAKFPGDPLPERLTLQFPAYANADVVAVSITVEIRESVIEGLDDYLKQLRDAKIDEGKEDVQKPLLVQQAWGPVSQIGRRICTFLSDTRSDVIARIREVIPEGIRDVGLEAKWTGELERAASAIRACESSWRGDADIAHLERVIVDLSGLVKTHRQVEFVCPMKLDPGGSVDLADFVERASEVTSPARYLSAGLQVPFTAEREPSTLGRASSLLLGILGATLVIMAMLDTTWLFSVSQWIGFNRDAPVPPSPEVGGLRDAVVAILVIFPGVLYGQFFQSRPKSPVGVKAQMATFALMSLLFVLPVMPAVILAVGGSSAAASVLLLLGGIVSIIVAVVSTFELRPARLLRLRLEEVQRIKPRIVSAQQAVAGG